MSEKQFTDVAETPREELECEKKYLYEYGMFWECNDGSKCQILEDDVCDLLNEQQATIQQKDKQLEKAKEYFMDYLSKEMSANNFSELWDLVIDDE